MKRKKINFVTALNKNSKEIQELIHASIDKKEKLYQISDKLRSMETEVNNLKIFASTIHNNIREITADSSEINYLITSRKEITEVQNDLTLLLDEIAQLTNSAIYFLQDSLPDETEVFFTPMADPEQKSSDKEPTIVDKIQKNQSEATVLIKYCARLLKEDINKNKSALILAYVRLQKILENSFAIMDSSYVNTGGSKKINEEKQEIRVLEAKLGKLNKEFKFKNLFSVFLKQELKKLKKNLV